MIKAVVSNGFIKNCISTASKKVQEKGTAALFNATAPFPCAEWHPHPLRSFYFTSITVFTKSSYTYTCNQKTDKKTIEKGKKVKERER